MESICNWHRRDKQKKVQLQKDQELLMGDKLNFQDSNGREGRDEGGEDQLQTFLEVICLAKHISKQGSKLAVQAKEEMNKVKSRALKETSAIKSKV